MASLGMFDKTCKPELGSRTASSLEIKGNVLDHSVEADYSSDRLATGRLSRTFSWVKTCTAWLDPAQDRRTLCANGTSIGRSTATIYSAVKLLFGITKAPPKDQWSISYWNSEHFPNAGFDRAGKSDR